jgi:hypothetical protein
MIGVARAVQVAAQVHTTVDPGGLPGGRVLRRMLNGLMYVGLLGCAAAVVVGGATWWLASHGGNYGAAFGGRKAVLAGLAGALVIGGAAGLVNFFYAAGKGVS